MTNRDAFNKQITKEIEAHIRKADKLGATPAIRLNGDKSEPGILTLTLGGNNKWDNIKIIR